jgi:hypothetical protein
MASDPQAHDRNQSRKRRRHGYRGYGSPLSRVREDHDGDFHWGLGFAGLGPSGAGGGGAKTMWSLILTACAEVSRKKTQRACQDAGAALALHLDAWPPRAGNDPLQVLHAPGGANAP